MNRWFEKCMSLLLALTLVLSMMPTMAIFAGAAELNGLADSGIGLSYTEAGKGGTVVWTAAGTTINGSVQGAGTSYFQGETSKLTIKNLKNGVAKLTFDYAVTVASGTVTIGGANANGNTYTCDLNAGESLEIVLSVSTATKKNNAAIAITNISLVFDQDATTTFQVAEGGSYTVTDAAGVTHEIKAETKLQQHSSKAYTLTATAAEGYMFYGWYNVTAGGYFSYSATATYRTDLDCEINPVFVPADSAVFQAGGAMFTDLGAAAAFAKENNITDVVLANGGVLSGDHTIPAGVTLLIPFDDKYTCYTDTPGMTGVIFNEEGKIVGDFAWEQPYAYSTLTLAAGATITVDGAISVGGEHYASSSAQGDVSHAGSPSGPVGFINMQAASEIVINNAGALYAWGYVIGEGTVTAKKGATVCENIQFMDYSGGSNTLSMATTYDDYRVAPMSQYYVQNVETKLVLEYGSTEYVYTALYVPSYPLAASAGVKLIGEGGMFRAAQGGSIVKQYLSDKDRLQIDVVGGGSINSLSVEFGGQSANTSAYVLPITNNLTINMLSGVTYINQDMSLLPGAEVTVSKGAELVLSNIDRTVTTGGETTVYPGCNLYIYDAADWKASKMLDPATNQYVSAPYDKFVYVNRNFAPLAYSPSRTYNRTDADLKDVVLDINGTFTINGYVYTSECGANICSTEGSGVIKMVSGLSKEYIDSKKNGSYNIWQAVQLDKAYFAPIAVTSVKLHNGNGSYTETEDAEAGDTYYWSAECGMWVKNWDKGTHKGTRGEYVDATCEEDGYWHFACEFCGDGKRYNTSDPATGHTCGEKVKEETEDGNTYTVVYCTVCSEEISRTATIANGICGDTLTWVLDVNGVLTISGAGSMNQFPNGQAPWYTERTKIKTVVINTGVTTISPYAFYNCNSLTSITIPTGIISIGKYAFYGCSSLASLNIPVGVTRVEQFTFAGCSSLTNITIPEGVTSIGVCAFEGCGNLTKITLPESITNIDSYAFSSCRGLTSVTLPKGITSISSSMFTACSSLTSITIPEGVTSIGDYAFSNCSSLTNITIPDSVTSIGYNAFKNCNGLTSITIPKGVTSIGDFAFENCSGLISITIPKSVTSIGGNAFSGCGNLWHVFYQGTQEAWENIEIFANNWNLKLAPRHYNCTGDEIIDLENKVCAICHASSECVWDGGVVTKDPTCSDTGAVLYTCTICGGTKTGEIAATGHDYEVVVTAPTCTADGYTTYTCACGHSYTADATPATGHSYDAGSVTTAPTCTEKGVKTYTCHCGDSYTEDVVATGHDYEVVVTAPTCTEKGVTTYACDCGHSYTEDIPATGHDYEAVVTAPTCTERGYTTYTCACGDTYVADEKAPSEHTYTVKLDKSTCTEDGRATYTCHCGDSYSYVIAATGHSWDGGCVTKEATCTENGSITFTCTACQIVETFAIKANGHNFTSAVTEPTCTEKGYTTYTCACGHSYVGDEVEAKGHTEGEVVKENVKDNSYDEVVYCTECDEELSRNTVVTVVYGDVDGDGDVDIMDANLVCAYYNGLKTLTETQLLAADVDGDGDVDIMDANLICSYYNGLISAFPVEAKTEQ